MKKLALLFVFLFISNIIFSQVTIIYYQLEHYEVNFFDCKMFLEDGSATSAADRLQLDAKYSIVVETGTTVTIAENYLPIYNNETYTGTVPMNWSIESVEVNPAELPGFDIISIVPDIGGQPAHYNNLSCCEPITLFRLLAEGGDICELSLRIFENDYDPTSLPSGNEFTNSMMIGTPADVYYGNSLPYNIGNYVDITIPEGEICEGECFTLEPTFNCTFLGTTYEWSTGETTETITVCPDISKNYYLNLSAPFVGDWEIEVLVSVDKGIDTDDQTELCVGVPVYYFPESGIWTSSDENIVTINNEGYVTPISTGTATISHTTEEGNCLDEVLVTVLSPDQPSILGEDVICSGETTQLYPSIGVTWESGNPATATVDDTGLVTGVGIGATVFTYTTEEGCISMPTPLVTVLIIPEPIITGLDTICTQETTTLTPSAGVTWESSDTSIAKIDNSGNVTGVSEGTTSFSFTDMATGCTSDESEPVTVLPSPMVQLSADSVCQGETVLATTIFEGGSWMITLISIFFEAPTIDAETGEIMTKESGTVSVHYTSTDGCMSDGLMLTILPKPDPDVTSNSPICIGENLIISTNSPPGTNYSYQWTGPNGFSSNEGNVIISNASLGYTGMYTLVASENGCVNDEINIDVLIEDCNPCDDMDPNGDPEIRGTAFIDNNGDGMLNENDSPLRNVLISIEPGNLSVLTDDDGSYQLAVPEGTYTLTANVNEGTWILDELTIIDIDIIEPCNLGFDFGFVPEPIVVPMVNLSMVNTIARCDFETKFTITVENTGTEPFESQLQFEFDNKTTFFYTEIVGATVSGNKVTTDIGPLVPFQPQKYIVTVKMPNGTSVLPMLDFSASLLDEAGEIIKEYGYTEQLRCSYDPNDKREYPDREGDENLTLMDETIEYTIRFQNNGNDTAYNVKIVDPLDGNINPLSIRVVGSSHNVETCIEGTDLIFLFENIYLVDSMTDYPSSQGYVTFKCNSKEGRAEFTPVNNTADIIFDTNPPIVTNQTLNTLVSVLCTDKSTTINKYICDGEEYLGHTESGTYTESFNLQFGCDSVVTINLTVQGITVSQQSFDFCGVGIISLGTEEYYIDSSTTIIDTLINDQGCITHILKFEITQIPDFIDIEGGLEFCTNEIGSIFPNLNGEWSSDNESVVIVDNDGNITTINSGEATIQFIDNATGCFDEVLVVVYPEPILLNEGSDEICINETNQLVSDTEGTWVSSDPEVATITNDGIVLGKNEGAVTFTFTSSTTLCLNSIDMVVLPPSDSNCTVSTNDLSEETVIIYPNPATGFVIIESKKEWKTIKLINTTGQVVYADENMKYQAKKRLDFNEISSGFYLLLVEGESGVVMKKLFIH